MNCAADFSILMFMYLKESTASNVGSHQPHKDHSSSLKIIDDIMIYYWGMGTKKFDTRRPYSFILNFDI